jgi:N6-L-threonylcarbamoyladenine synthase
MAKDGNPQAFPFPEGKISLPTGGFHAYDSSFSGLKTAVLRLVEKFEPDNLPVADIAASFQDTVARSLTRRTINCALDYGLKTIAIGGGVAANSALRNHLETAAKNHHLTVYFPPLKLCTDNAAMIARAAVDHYDLGHFSDLSLGVRSRLPLSEVMQLYNISF